MMSELFVMNTFLEQRGYNAYLSSSNKLKVEGNTLYSYGTPLAQIVDETLYVDLSTQHDENINEHRDMLVRLAITFPYPISYLAKLSISIDSPLKGNDKIVFKDNKYYIQKED